MKCPKCGYLGFETSERCRNCGYDFSLALEITPVDELPLHQQHDADPLADLDFERLERDARGDDLAGLDLDRLIGESPADPPPAPPPSAPSPRRRAAGRAPGARAAPGAPGAPSAPGAASPSPAGELPLFGGDDDTPLITAPRPPRPPLSVRRTTPEIPRVRPRSTPTHAADEAGPSSEAASQVNHVGAAAPSVTPHGDQPLTPAPAAARLAAAIIDGLLLGAINLAVVYFTLALAGLTWNQYDVLPVAPLLAFFAIMAGGYLTAFVAASGQTIGKMATGIRVLGDDGRRVDVAGAVLRAAGCAASLLTLGLGYLPALFAADRRALHDRVAGTRVVSAR